MGIRRPMIRHGVLRHFRPLLFDLPCNQPASFAYGRVAASACARLTTTAPLSSTALVASATPIAADASLTAVQGRTCTTCSAVYVTLSSVRRC